MTRAAAAAGAASKAAGPWGVAPGWAGPRLAAVIVWLAWLLATGGAFGLIWRFGADVSYWDEWSTYIRAVGGESITLQWLWYPHNEHRIPLSRLVYMTAVGLADGDVRAGMAVSAGLLSALAAGLLWALRQARAGTGAAGRWFWTDALMPLTVLSVGQYFNLLWAFQICFTLTAALFGLVVIGMLRLKPESRWPHYFLICTGVVLLPLCAGPGLVLAVALAPGLAVLAAMRLRARAWSQAGVLAGGVLATGVVVGLYLYGFRGQNSPQLRWELDPLWRTLQEFFCAAWVPEAHRLAWQTLALCTLALACGAWLLAGWKWWKCPAERLRLVGLLSCMAAVAALALSIAAGRSGGGMVARYATLAMPIVYLNYLVYSLYGGRLARRTVLPGMLALALWLLWAPGGNLAQALVHGRAQHQQVENFRRDIRDGAPLEVLLARYGRLCNPHPRAAEAVVTGLHARRLGPFRGTTGPLARVSRDGLAVVELPLEPALARNMVFRDGAWHGTSADPYLEFALARPRQVEAIELVYELSDAGPLNQMEIWWDVTAGQPISGQGLVYLNWQASRPEAQTTTLWVRQAIDRVRIDPDTRPCRFRLLHLRVLVRARNDEIRMTNQ